jgi:hypothetical protein
MVYRPRFKKQWNDPSGNLDWLNCTMAAGAMALDFDTLGHANVLPGTLRSHSGDLSGGTGLGDPGLTRAWRYYGQILHVGTGEGWSSVLTSLRAYRGVVLQIMYGALPARYQSPLNSFSFAGPHAVYLNPEFQSDGDILMGDPLNDKFIWVPGSYLRSAAAVLAKDQTGDSTELFWASTDAHKPVVTDPVAYIHTVKVTASPYLNIRESASAGSADVGNLAVGTKVKTTRLRRNGGRYIANGQVRTDWLGFIHNGEEDWIARAYTTVVA